MFPTINNKHNLLIVSHLITYLTMHDLLLWTYYSKKLIVTLSILSEQASTFKSSRRLLENEFFPRKDDAIPNSVRIKIYSAYSTICTWTLDFGHRIIATNTGTITYFMLISKKSMTNVLVTRFKFIFSHI